MKVMIAKALGAVLSAVLFAALLPFAMLIAAGKAVQKLCSWVELHAVFKGDEASRDRSRYKDDV